MILNMNLFGSSGIRGLANVKITPSMAYKIGETLASLPHVERVVLGRDSRITGPMLENALCSGALSCGADVLMEDIIPTPVVAWKTMNTQNSVGVMITASHNPPSYNGFKVFDDNGMSVTEEEQRKITDILQGEYFKHADWKSLGTAHYTKIREEYIEAIIDGLRVKNNWHLACDCLCGATGTTAKKTFDAASLQTDFLNAQPDGRFPAGNPEPNPENLSRLGLFVAQRGADIGFAFDGDGDRMMAIDEWGNPVSPDMLLASYAGYLTRRKEGGVVITHVGASMCIDDMVKKEGGIVKRTRVGDSFIAQAMDRHDAIFGGEPVGAWIHPDTHMCPDGILSALKLLEALEEEDVTLSEFVNRSPEYPVIRSSLECPEERKECVMGVIKGRYEMEFTDVESVNTVDGIRLQLREGWILIRPSGTEPLIRITAEARNHRKAEEIMEKGRKLVNAVNGAKK